MPTIREKLSAIRAGAISRHAKILDATPKPLKPVVRNIDMITWGYAMLCGMSAYIVGVPMMMDLSGIDNQREDIHKIISNPLRVGLRKDECLYLSAKSRPLFFAEMPKPPLLMGLEMGATLLINRPSAIRHDLGLAPVFEAAACADKARKNPIPASKAEAVVNKAADDFTASAQYKDAVKSIPPGSRGFFRLEPEKPIYPFPWQWFNNDS
jgi:hypothetical protein